MPVALLANLGFHRVFEFSYQSIFFNGHIQPLRTRVGLCGLCQNVFASIQRAKVHCETEGRERHNELASSELSVLHECSYNGVIEPRELSGRLRPRTHCYSCIILDSAGLGGGKRGNPPKTPPPLPWPRTPLPPDSGLLLGSAPETAGLCGYWSCRPRPITCAAKDWWVGRRVE